MLFKRKEKIIFSPLKGEVIPLSQVSDPAFNEKQMGDGIAINPIQGDLMSPTDAKIIMIFPTNHAIGLRDKFGTDILIHIGIDTVMLDGKYFEVFVKKGENVKKGQKLISFDIAKISNCGYSTVTMIIITNKDQALLNITKQKDVEYGERIIEYE